MMSLQNDWLDRYQHVLMNNFGRPKAVFVRGSGCFLVDADGKQYTDMFSGIAVGGLGHGHPAVMDAVTRQLSTLGHISNLFASQPQIELGERLGQLACGGSPDRQARVYFANSGAEAAEAAFKITRLTGKKKIVAMEGSFHGRTMGALALTSTEKYRKPFEPLPGEVVFIPYGDSDAARQAVDDETAAVVVETIQGENGVVCASHDFLSELRRLTREHEALLWVDEVQTGIGRCGEWFTSVSDGLEPDIVTVAKGLGNGLPIAACIGMGPVGELFTPGLHGSTYSGNPVMAAAALAVLNTIQDDGLLNVANARGESLAHAIENLGSAAIAHTRGRGLLRGIVLNRPIAQQTADLMLERGWIINAPRPDVLRLAPPLIVTEEIIGEFAETLGDVLAGIDSRD